MINLLFFYLSILMCKTDDMVFFALILTIFTGIFVKLPTLGTFTVVRDSIYSVSKPFMVETCSINELLMLKLLVTFMMFKHLNLTLEQFTAYIYLQEIFMLIIFGKASLIFQPAICTLLYHVLLKQNNNIKKYFNNIKSLI